MVTRPIKNHSGIICQEEKFSAFGLPDFIVHCGGRLHFGSDDWKMDFTAKEKIAREMKFSSAVTTHNVE